jgi:ATP adenylyltransferase
MQYVTTADSDPGCFLCTKPGQHRDGENLILSRGEHVYALLNLFPYNTAHTLVAPYAHGGDFAALPPAAAAELTSLTQRLVRAIEHEYRPNGFNLGMNLGRVAGAGLPDHLHTHIVPRWGGDTNFMTITGDTKVMPETLDRTYDRLVARLAADGD